MRHKTVKQDARARRTEKVPTRLDQLVQDPKNARRHTERNLAMIAESLETVGAARSIVIDERGRVLAGNATREQAQAKGLKLRVVDTDARTLVAVRRRDLSERDKTVLALYDNRAAELAEWDPAVLAALTSADESLKGLWHAAELGRILEALDGEKAGLVDPNAVPALRRTSIVEGDLFALGAHRLICGDSTDADTISRLMGKTRARLFATDPPYLVDYRGRSKQARNDAAEPNWDDSSQGGELFDRFIAVAQAAAVDERAAWYCWHASRRQALLEASWTKAGAFVHQQIIWVKTRPVMTRSVYLWRHEPCFFGWRQGKKPRVRRAPIDDRRPTTVWEGPQATVGDLPTTAWFVPSTEVETDQHPTSKPVRLFTIPLLMHTERGEAAYEPFSGSGSQLIATEQTGRACYAVERDPKYVQLAIDRWEAFTGQKARKLDRVLHGRGTSSRKRKGRAA